jgi:PAS domain-containing protein
MLDISDIKNQQQQPKPPRATGQPDRQFASGDLRAALRRRRAATDFFSASLQPLLGWTPPIAPRTDWVQLIHPEDRDLYFERTRQLLREGSVRARYRLRDSAAITTGCSMKPSCCATTWACRSKPSACGWTSPKRPSPPNRSNRAKSATGFWWKTRRR